MALTLFDNQPNQDAYEYFSDFAVGGKRYAQTFTAANSYSLSRVVLTGYGQGNQVKVSIKATSGGAPYGADLVSKTITLPTPEDYGDNIWNFDTPLLIIQGIKYALVVEILTGTSFGWTRKVSNVYAGGAPFSSTTGADGSWSEVASKDCRFLLYGEPMPPTVTTQAVSDISKATATGNGDVTSDGGYAITERGVCYCLASHGTPDTGDDKDIAEGTTGAFTTSLSGLTPFTAYHVRAYAINDGGTSYGEMVEFTTAVAATYVEIITADLLSGAALPATGFNGQTFLDTDQPGAYIWIP